MRIFRRRHINGNRIDDRIRCNRFHLLEPRLLQNGGSYGAIELK